MTEENNYPSIKPAAETPVVDSKEVSTPKSNTPQVTTSEHTEKPPSLSSEPYLIKELDLELSKTHFEMPSLIKEANEFLLSELKRQNLKDTPEAYKGLLERYTKNLPDDVDQYALVEHIVDLIRIDRKLIEAMLEKAELEKKPIEELTSYQLRKRIEGK